MSETTKPDLAPLAGWLLVQSNGMLLIGRDRTIAGSGKFTLNPVLQLGFNPNGIFCLPVWLPLSIDSLDITTGAIVKEVADLPGREREALAKAVAHTQDVVRAARSGVEIAGPSGQRLVKP